MNGGGDEWGWKCGRSVKPIAIVRVRLRGRMRVVASKREVGVSER